MKTISIKKSEISKKWWVADAEGKTLGRFASKIAQVLRGKHKPEFTPHMDMGDFVIVINAEKVRVTGKKETEKKYFRHSGYPGGVKSESLDSVRRNHPDRILRSAVKGMLPHNRLGRSIMSHLKVYNGSTHPHIAQAPKSLKI